MFNRNQAQSVSKTASTPKEKVNKRKLVLWIGAPVSLFLLALLSLVPVLGQSTASRGLDVVGAHRMALGLDGVTSLTKLNYLSNFADLPADLSSCDPLWDAYKSKPAALALAELTALPNVTRLGLQIDEEIMITNESRVYRNEDSTVLVLKDLLDMELDLAAGQDALDLRGDERMEFLDSVFSLNVDFHVIGDLEAEEGEPASYLGVNALRLTSEAGFEGEFSGGYYGLGEELEVENSVEDLDEEIVNILSTPLENVLSDESGYALAEVFCAGFEKYEVGAPETKTIAGNEVRVRPITFYPKADMVQQMVRPTTRAVEKITQDRTLEKFLANNAETIWCQDIEEGFYDSVEECVEDNLETQKEIWDDARENPLTESDTYEEDMEAIQEGLDSLPFTVQPITSYIGMRDFDVAGYDLRVTVTPEDGEFFDEMNLSLSQYATPEIMEGLAVPSEHKDISELPDDFVRSSLYTGLEKEFDKALAEWEEDQAAQQAEFDAFFGQDEGFEVRGDRDVGNACDFTDSCEDDFGGFETDNDGDIFFDTSF